MTTILTKKKDTAGAPAAGDLTNAAGGAELAVNTATKRLYTKDSGGNVVEIGTNPSSLDVPVIISGTTTDAALRITQTGTGNALLVEDSTNPDATPFVIDATGRVLVGATSTSLTVSNDAGQSVSPQAVVLGTGLSSSSSALTSWSSTANVASTFALVKSKSGTIGTNGIVASGDSLGRHDFIGDDGASFITAAAITAFVDGTPGTNDMPGRLVFSTTADGASTPTERMRIDSAGDVGIGTTSPVTRLEIAGTNNTAWSVTASITGTTMDVTAVTTSGVAVGDLVHGSGVQPYTRVTALGTGTGGIGTYTVSVSQTLASGTVVGCPTYGNTLIRITETDTAVTTGQPTGGLQFYTSDNSTPTAGVGAYVAGVAESSAPDTSLVFGTRDGSGGGIDANERMRIDSSGNVGIGTTSPPSGSRLAVVGGGIQLSGGTTSQEGIRIQRASGYASISGINNDNNAYNALAFFTSASEAVRIDGSGNVGIGTSSPAVKLDVNGITGWGGATTGQTAQIVGASSGITGGGNFRVLSNTTQAADVGGVLTLGGYYTSTTNSIDFGAILGAKENSTGGNTAGYLAFGTRVNAGNMTERMRIDSSGNVLVGATATNYGERLKITFPNTQGIHLNESTNSSSVNYQYFTKGSTPTNVGAIYYNGSVMAYQTTSDYRLKENIAPMTGALAKISALKPVTYTWKDNQRDGEGFIAHELQEHFPDAVSGIKDDVDEDGNPKYQGMDASILIATLTAAIQEQQALITALTARITALENK